MSVFHGTVTLCGAVPGWIEHDEAIAVARSTLGAAHVNDALRVLIAAD